MTIRRIDDTCSPWARFERCLNPDHNVPNMICLQPGTYEHVCPGCHKKTVFRVTGTYMCADGVKTHRSEPEWKLASRAPMGNAAGTTHYVNVGSMSLDEAFDYVNQVRNLVGHDNDYFIPVR
jgi:hypothetical protein